MWIELSLFLKCKIGTGVIAPFMTVHMKSLGITVEETALINGIVPPFAILSPSAMGMIADKLGNFKVSRAAASSYNDEMITLELLNCHRVYYRFC